MDWSAVLGYGSDFQGASSTNAADQFTPPSTKTQASNLSPADPQVSQVTTYNEEQAIVQFQQELVAQTSSSSFSSSPSPCLPLPSTSVEERFVNIFSQDFVKNVLLSKFDGQHAFEYASKNNGILRESHRTSISSILMSAIIEPSPSRNITVSDLCYLTDEILTLFPGEKQRAVYYEKPDPRINKNGSGTLYAALQLHRKKRRRSSTSCSLKRNRISFPETAAPSQVCDNEPCSDEEILKNLEFLKHNIPDIDTLEVLWSQTYPERIKEIYKPGSVQEYFDLYPVLKTQAGCKLVSSMAFNEILLLVIQVNK